MKQYNFATLLSVREGRPVVSHLPFLVDASRGEQGTLLGHMAKANQHWRCFAAGEATVIFQGPHSYVSPSWYVPRPDNVPTWNYAVCHAYGHARILVNEKDAYQQMARQVALYEEQYGAGWSLNLSDQDRHHLLASIVVFEITVTKLEARFKLSQGDPANAPNVAHELARSDREPARAIAALMTTNCLPGPS